MRGRVVLGVAGGIAAIALATVALRDSSDDPPLTKAEVDRSIEAAVDKAEKAAAAEPARSVTVFQTILPSLVVIQTDRRSATSVNPGANGIASNGTPDTSAPSDSTEESSDPDAPGEADAGLGTGVIINSAGDILTAHHVIAGATSIEVSFADGTRSTAVVSSQEPDKDIAVLRADRGPEVIVPAVMGGGVRIGDETYAVGHPLGLTGSLSAGVVSGLGRSIPLPNGVELDGLIQFDAAVNPGNSGGPLLNRDGQVVGIVTALANPSDQNYFIGIGFAVPIETAGGAAGAPPQ
ncbi:MAG: S1C family serine protease [Acidimicrobiia bacterium]